jgi:hypothetical protein
MNVAKAALYLEYIAFCLRYHFSPETLRKTMSEDNDQATIEPPVKRGRGPGKPKATRRNFGAELAQLQSRVNVALKLLDKIPAPSRVGLLETAVEILEGK